MESKRGFFSRIGARLASLTHDDDDARGPEAREGAPDLHPALAQVAHVDPGPGAQWQIGRMVWAPCKDQVRGDGMPGETVVLVPGANALDDIFGDTARMAGTGGIPGDGGYHYLYARMPDLSYYFIGYIDPRGVLVGDAFTSGEFDYAPSASAGTWGSFDNGATVLPVVSTPFRVDASQVNANAEQPPAAANARNSTAQRLTATRAQGQRPGSNMTRQPAAQRPTATRAQGQRPAPWGVPERPAQRPGPVDHFAAYMPPVYVQQPAQRPPPPQVIYVQQPAQRPPPPQVIYRDAPPVPSPIAGLLAPAPSTSPELDPASAAFLGSYVGATEGASDAFAGFGSNDHFADNSDPFGMN